MIPTAPHTEQVFIVGDIHGCLGSLEHLLRKACFNPDIHQLVSVGDTLNRGPHNLGVLQLLTRMGARIVQGNHERGLLYATAQEYAPAWFDPKTFCPDLIKNGQSDRWLSSIADWPLWIETEDWIVVHAGLHPVRPLESTSPTFLTSVRACTAEGMLPSTVNVDGAASKPSMAFQPWHDFYKGEKPIFYGHWAQQGIHSTEHTHCLDGGCVYGRELVGCWLPSLTLVRVPGEAHARIS
ncbi:MAG: metallophosphoesterase [Myxococcota bacterium]